VLNTLNGRCEARPIRGVSSPVERLVTVCLRVEANRRVIVTGNFILICIIQIDCYASSNPASCVSPDARGWSLYLTQLGGFVSRQRSFLRKEGDLAYLILQIAVSTYLKVWALLSWRENKKFLKKYSWKKFWKKFLKKILKIFFERKIHRVESGRAYTHVHRPWSGAGCQCFASENRVSDVLIKFLRREKSF
jgi:hypothetical protein